MVSFLIEDANSSKQSRAGPKTFSYFFLSTVQYKCVLLIFNAGLWSSGKPHFPGLFKKC